MKNTDSIAHIREIALAQFESSLPHGSFIHGPTHWDMVGLTSAILLSANGHNPVIGHLFGMLHDCCRENDYADPGHGERAADFIVAIRGIIPINDDEFEELYYAIRMHNTGATAHRASIAGCLFDADRLDLGRVGAVIDPDFLSSSHAEALLLGEVQRIDTPAGTLAALWHGSDYLDGETRLQVTKPGVPVYLSESQEIAIMYGRPHRVLLATPGVIDLTDPMDLIHKPEFAILKEYQEDLSDAGMTFRASGEPFDLCTALESGAMYHEDPSRGITEELVRRMTGSSPTVRMYDDTGSHHDGNGETVASWLTSCQTNTILLADDE
jgi:uncharacterized protein